MESVDKPVIESVDKQEPKKSYQSPELIVYGDIRLITGALTTTGKNDSAMTGNTKT
jgi:hypothetical protein